MTWTASGLYAQTLVTESLIGVAAATFSWNSLANKFYMTNNTDTPAYNQALASAIYSTTNEVSGTGWAAGGIAVSALATGPSTMAPAFSYATPSPSTIVQWGGNNVSVAGTTITGAFGGFFYSVTAAAQYKFMGIYFGGSGYSTTAGTFAITWAGGIICAITVAATS